MKKQPGKLEVLVAAQNLPSTDQLPLVAKQLLGDKCPALLINQSEREPDVQDSFETLRIFTYPESGISRSRNRALEHAEGDLLLIADDDIELIPGYSKIVSEAFNENPKADIITFQCLNEHGEKRKNYADSSFWHSMRTLMRVSSIEIAVRRSSLQHNSLSFDTRFGIGTNIPTGAETVFLCDAQRRGYKILYLPYPIVRHPDESSGRALFQNPTLIKAKGSMFYRIFGWKAYGACVLFALKKKRETGYSPIKNIQLMFTGIREFKALDHGK